MNASKSFKGSAAGPTAPRLTTKDILRQVWADAYGKEVQSAATYSYLWLADQFGHVCVGIIVDFAATAASGLAFVLLGWHPYTYWLGRWPGLAITIVGVSLWEWNTYRSSLKQATGVFPIDKKLLRANAVIAATYMTLGGVLGFAFHLELAHALIISVIIVVVAVLLAPSWLRQKIIWQKASIPYLFRLADAVPSIGKDDATLLQNLIKDGAPPIIQPHQVIVGGPIGSGRTPMAAGIATEFAFKNHKVRYLTLDCLLEFAANSSSGHFPNDPGPTTISYWPWSESQVVVIDGIGPVISVNEPGRQASLGRFNAMLQNELRPVAEVLKRCHTVWVLGDLSPSPSKLEEVLAKFAKAIAEYCDGAYDPLVIELSSPPERLPSRGAFLPSTRAAAQVTAVRSIRRVNRA